MAPKKIPHAESSSSQPRFDSHRFPTLNKSIQFQEHIMKRTVESEREVDEDLLEKQACQSLSNRNWCSLLKFETSAIYIDWVREFYCNMELVSSTFLKTFVQGKWITITAADIVDFLDIPIVEGPDYPLPEDSQVLIDYDLISTTLCGEDTLWPSGCLPHGNLTEEYRFLNHFVCHNLESRGHTSDVSHKNGYLLYSIGTGKHVNIPQVILNVLIKILTNEVPLHSSFRCFHHRVSLVEGGL